MKVHKIIIGLLFYLAFPSLFAVDAPPLTIGTEAFAPPFVTIGAGNHIYGFDADMMQIICHRMQRKCQFQAMSFNNLIEDTASGKIDMAVSAIAITMDRLRIVNFSIPYLTIYHRFLTKAEIAKQPFKLSVLNNKRIGYEEGTILADRIKSFSIQDPELVAYKNIGEEIVALNEDEVDFVILDNPTAMYWQNNSAGNLKVFGDPLPSGLGLGIAINPRNPALLTAVNLALNEFLNDGGFHATFNKYLAPFSSEPLIKPKS